MLTKVLRFSGERLFLNYRTSAAGSLRVEVQDAEGRALPGYAAADCLEIIGDEIQREVRWRRGSDVREIAGKAVRLLFILEDADLYSLRFGPNPV